MTPDVSKALVEAAGHFRQGDLARAETICRRLLLADPAEVDVIHLLGLTRKAQKDLQEAERLLRKCLQLEPHRADILANLGNLLHAAGRVDEACQTYREALTRNPACRQARLGLARALIRSGRHREALSETAALTANDAADAEAWTIAGSALRAMGETERAETALRTALGISPGSPVARHNLGALLNELSRSEEALAQLEPLAGSGFGGAELELNIASALISLNRFDEAEARLVRSVKAAPRDPRTQRLLARLRFMRGDDSYCELLAQAVERHADDLVLRITQSQVLRGAGRADAAAETLAGAPDPSDPRLDAELAAVHQESGRFEAACQAARAAMSKESSNAGYSALLIDALVSLGRADEAMPHIEAARRRRPLDQWYVAMEATAARLLGDSRYESWYDYDRLIRVFELEPPAGWSGIEAFHADLAPVLHERHRLRAHPLDQSLRHGTQTPRGLLGDPDPHIKAFIAAVAAPLETYLIEAGFGASHVFRSRNTGKARLSGCWSVRLGPGGYHLNHVHSHGWISSAYYLEVPREAADTERKSGWIKFGEPRFPTPGATAERYVQPRPGRLVLFPSYMWHGTTPITGSESRLTIAFDAVPAE